MPAVGVNANGLGEVFRINLEQGRFMREYEVDVGGDDLTSLGGELCKEESIQAASILQPLPRAATT